MTAPLYQDDPIMVQDLIDKCLKDKTGFVLIVDGSRGKELTVRFQVSDKELVKAIELAVTGLDGERPGIKDKVKESL